MGNLSRISKFLLLLLCVGFSAHSVAQQLKTQIGVCKKRTFKVLPIAYYTPETRLAGGALFYYMFCLRQGDTVTRRSNIQLYATATVNRQLLLESSWQIYTTGEKYIFSGDMDISRFPEFFYGIGNNTKDSAELYTFDRYKLGSNNLKNIGDNMFLGIHHNLQYLFNLRLEEANMMRNAHIPGANGFFVHGVGPVFIYDTRDNVLNTFRGNYMEVSYNIYNRFLGSNYDYHSFIVDVRKYYPIYKKTTLAVNYYANLNFGELPFRAMPALGGGRYLRGYYTGRYRDNNMMVLHAEFRGDLFWRLGFAVFTGIGRVAHTLNEFRMNDWKYNVGAGIRFKINRAENVNLRIDYGYTGESHGLYVIFAESF